MSPKKQRAPDQDAAIEAAFVAGTLPEEDRRRVEENARVTQAAADRVTEEAFAAGEALVAAVEAVDPLLAILEKAGPGSVFEKTATGWTVKYVDGGTQIVVQGPTIADALASHGAQVEHPKTREQLAREAATRE